MTQTVKTAYVRITAKVPFSYTSTVMEDMTTKESIALSDRMDVGDTSYGFVDPSQITSRAKEITCLEVELSDIDETGEERSISMISTFPRSKVTVERVDCSLCITELLAAL